MQVDQHIYCFSLNLLEKLDARSNGSVELAQLKHCTEKVVQIVAKVYKTIIRLIFLYAIQKKKNREITNEKTRLHGVMNTISQSSNKHFLCFQKRESKTQT